MSALKRQLHIMPDFVVEALKEQNLINQYMLRPAYQRNDYIGWINRAKREDTRMKRLNQMLEELRNGDEYMGWNIRRRCLEWRMQPNASIIYRC